MSQYWCLLGISPVPILYLTEFAGGVNAGIFVDEVERRAVDIIEPCHEIVTRMSTYLLASLLHTLFG